MGENDPVVPSSPLEHVRIVSLSDSHFLNADDVNIRIPTKDACEGAVVEVLVGEMSPRPTLGYDS